MTEAKTETARVLALLRDGAPVTDATIAVADAAAAVNEMLEGVAAGGYVAIQAYLPRYAARDERLATLREAIRDRTGAAITVGYGPRYLHSTGQLHKGGPATGAFLQLVADHAGDVPIPDAHETFGMLIDAQALGDAASLRRRGRPVVRVSLGGDPDAGLDALVAAIRG